MAQAGWYPDPAGTPATYRYWNGAQWSSVTTSDPASPPPDGGMPPPPPGSPRGYGDVPAGDRNGPGGYAGARPPMPPTSGGSDGGGRGKVVLIAVAVVVAVIVTATLGVLGVRSLGGVGAKSGDDVPATSPTDGGDQLVPPPDDSRSAPPGTAQPPPAECRRGAPTVFGDQSGGRIGSHGLSIPRVEDYQVDPLQSFAFTWAFDLIPQVQKVEEGWASVYGVGGVETSFGSPEETAEAVVECMTKAPQLYSGFTDRKDRSSEEIDVPGAESAWRITTEIHVDNPGISVDGDVVEVIVVDTGNKALYGLYTSVVPIGDKERLAQQQEVTGALRAD